MNKIARTIKPLLRLKKWMQARPQRYFPAKIQLVLGKFLRDSRDKRYTKPMTYGQYVNRAYKDLLNKRYSLGAFQGYPQGIVTFNEPGTINFNSILTIRDLVKRQLKRYDEFSNSLINKIILSRRDNLRDNKTDKVLYRYLKRAVDDPNTTEFNIPKYLENKLAKSRYKLLSNFVPQHYYRPNIRTSDKFLIRSYKDGYRPTRDHYYKPIVIRAYPSKQGFQTIASKEPFQFIDDPNKWLYGAKDHAIRRYYDKGDPIFMSGLSQVAKQYSSGLSGFDGERPYILRMPRELAKHNGQPSFGTPHFTDVQPQIRLKKLKELKSIKYKLKTVKHAIHNPGLDINNNPNYEFIVDNTSGNFDKVFDIGIRGKDGNIYKAKKVKNILHTLIGNGDIAL